MRLLERVPSASLIGTAEIRQHRLTFHKKSKDESAKCNMLETGTESDYVVGAIYSLSPKHKNELDRFEGLGYGYIDNHIKVSFEGVEYNCFTYLAQQSHIVEHLKPYHWYKELVVLGTKRLNFPESYVAAIKKVESVEDPNEMRRADKNNLIEEIIKYR
jgi:gamma-glutamylcyclotransferase (GGCT)/AIG2-like uncharacterized protein YtfP